MLLTTCNGWRRTRSQSFFFSRDFQLCQLDFAPVTARLDVCGLDSHLNTPFRVLVMCATRLAGRRLSRLQLRVGILLTGRQRFQRNALEC